MCWRWRRNEMVVRMNRSFQIQKMWGIWLAVLAMIAPRVVAQSQPRSYTATNSWSIQLGHHNESSPALDTHGNIYITTREGKLFAINPDSSIRWSYTFGFESASTPAIGDDGTIYFGCRDRRVYAVDDTGKLRWSFKTGNWVDASPAIGADGTVHVGSWDKLFYALDRAGKLRWKFATDGTITSSAAIDQAGVIYFGSHDRKFYALHPDGTKKWEFATGGAILSSPAIGADGALYFTSTDGHLRALNSDGSLRWKLHTGGINASSPVLGVNGAIYVGINTNHCAVSAEGKLLWSMQLSPRGYPLFDWIVAAPVALVDGTCITTGTDLVMAIYDERGPWWRTSLKSGIRASPAITPDGTVYGASTWTGLFAFTNFPSPATTTWPMFRANPQRTGRVSQMH